MRSAFSALRCSRKMALVRRSLFEMGFEKRIPSLAVAKTPLCKTLRLKRRTMFSLASDWSFLVTFIAIGDILPYLGRSINDYFKINQATLYAVVAVPIIEGDGKFEVEGGVFGKVKPLIGSKKAHEAKRAVG